MVEQSSDAGDNISMHSLYRCVGACPGDGWSKSMDPDRSYCGTYHVRWMHLVQPLVGKALSPGAFEWRFTVSRIDFDPVLHPPTRLQIAAILAKVDDVEFAVIKDIVEVSDSVLSKHLSALSQAGYVKLEKAKRDGRQRTWASLTSKGSKAFASHVRALQTLALTAEHNVSVK